jgi:large repetitive protein
MLLTGCTLQGTPTVTGSFNSQLTLTIPGYTGSTRVDATIAVAGPTLGPSTAPPGTGLRIGFPITGLSIVGLSFTPPFAIRSTDTLVYRIVSGTLPAGLTFDTATGLISGSPTQSGFFPLTVGATLTRGSAIYQLADYVTIGVSVLSS